MCIRDRHDAHNVHNEDRWYDGQRIGTTLILLDYLAPIWTHWKITCLVTSVQSVSVLHLFWTLKDLSFLPALLSNLSVTLCVLQVLCVLRGLHVLRGLCVFVVCMFCVVCMSCPDCAACMSCPTCAPMRPVQPVQPVCDVHFMCCSYSL